MREALKAFAGIFDIEDFSGLRHGHGVGYGLIHVGENGFAVLASEYASSEHATVFVESGILGDVGVFAIRQMGCQLVGES